MIDILFRFLEKEFRSVFEEDDGQNTIRRSYVSWFETWQILWCLLVLLNQSAGKYSGNGSTPCTLDFKNHS